MRTTLDIDDDVLEIARARAARNRQSLGATISEMARQGTSQAWLDLSGKYPVIRTPPGSPKITEEMVRDALADEY